MPLYRRNSTLHDIDLMVENLLDLWQISTTESYDEGISWYNDARKFARKLAKNSPYTYRQCAAVIAVTSPMCRWNQNKNFAAKAIAENGTGNYGLFPTSINPKVRRILAGDFKAISGPKVTAFYRNIVGNKDEVTVDRWACLAATGSKNPMNNHEIIKSAYRIAAAKVGHSPRDMQAVLWCEIRKLEPKRSKKNG